MNKKITDFEVLTFDCYGTMIDWESGIWDALQPLIWKNKRDDMTREQTLRAFARIETAQEINTPDMVYSDLLAHVHCDIAKEFEITSNPGLDRDFGLSVSHWPAFPDSADALRKLKKHFKLVILSNVHREGFASSNRKLGVDFDAIYTAQDVGSYKPNIANFEFMLKVLKNDFGIESDQILHTAQSLHHDHVPATQAGLNKAWIDRQNLSNSDNWGATAIVDNRPEVNFTFTSLMEMAESI